MVVWEVVFQGWAAPLELRICLGGIQKMVVWELSSQDWPHPWNRGFAWEALRKWWCGSCLPRVGRTPGTEDLPGMH